MALDAGVGVHQRGEQTGHDSVAHVANNIAGTLQPRTVSDLTAGRLLLPTKLRRSAAGADHRLYIRDVLTSAHELERLELDQC